SAPTRREPAEESSGPDEASTIRSPAAGTGSDHPQDLRDAPLDMHTSNPRIDRTGPAAASQDGIGFPSDAPRDRRGTEKIRRRRRPRRQMRGGPPPRATSLWARSSDTRDVLVLGGISRRGDSRSSSPNRRCPRKSRTR